MARFVEFSIQFICVKIRTSLCVCAHSKVTRPVIFLSCIPGQFRDRIIFSIRLRFLRFFVGSISNEPTTLSLHMHSISPFQSILVVRNRLVPYHVNKQTNKQTNKQANKQTNKTHKLTN